MYDASRLANFGRDNARAHAAFSRSAEKLQNEINAAIEEGVSPVKIAHDVFGRCNDRKDQHNLLSSLMAMVQMGKIPQEVLDPFDKGIRPRRI